MDPNSDTLSDAILGFSVIMICWVAGIVLLLGMFVDRILGGNCLAVIDNVFFLIGFACFCFLTLIIPYIIFSYNRNYFKILLSMHRIYKDEYPDFVPVMLIYTAILFFCGFDV